MQNEKNNPLRSADDAEDLDWKDFREAMKEHSASKRANNRASAPRVLNMKGIPYTSHNHGAHLVVHFHNQPRIDFWPGTGLWKDRVTRTQRRGVFPLLGYLTHLDRTEPKDPPCPNQKQST